MGRTTNAKRAAAYHETDFGADNSCADFTNIAEPILLPYYRDRVFIRPSTSSAETFTPQTPFTSATDSALTSSRYSRYSNCSSNSTASSGAMIHTGSVLPPIPARADSAASAVTDTRNMPLSNAMDAYMTYSMYAPCLEHNDVNDEMSLIDSVSFITKKASCPASLHLAHHYNDTSTLCGTKPKDNNDDNDYGYVAPRLLCSSIANAQNYSQSNLQNADMSFPISYYSESAIQQQHQQIAENVEHMSSMAVQTVDTISSQQKKLNCVVDRVAENDFINASAHQTQLQTNLCCAKGVYPNPRTSSQQQQQDDEAKLSGANYKDTPASVAAADEESRQQQKAIQNFISQANEESKKEDNKADTQIGTIQLNTNHQANNNCTSGAFYDDAAVKMRQNSEENNEWNKNNNNSNVIEADKVRELTPNLKVASNSQPTTTRTVTTTNEVKENNNAERSEKMLQNSNRLDTDTVDSWQDCCYNNTATTMRRQQKYRQQLEKSYMGDNNNNYDSNKKCDNNEQKIKDDNYSALQQQQQKQQVLRQSTELLYDGIYKTDCDGATMRASNKSDNHFTTAAMTAAAAALAAKSKARAPIACLTDASTSSNRNSTGSTSSGSQASSGVESAKISNSSASNLTQSSGCAAQHLAGAAAYSLESPSASSIVSSTSSGAGSTASRCSTYYGSMDCYDTSGLNGACSATAGPSCASSGILSDASSSSMATTISPSTSSYASVNSAAGGTNTALRSNVKGNNGGRVNIADMLRRGISESEILAEWLQRLCLSQYLSQFLTQGYDLASIARATPEDLTALGITRPEDRKRLMQDIQLWSSAPWADNWPTELVDDDSVRGWLTALGLVQYVERFEASGCCMMRDAEKLTWEDLEDMGVKKLGHMKRICIALKKHKATKISGGGLTATSLSQRHFDEAPSTTVVGYATINRKRPPLQQQSQLDNDAAQQQHTLPRIATNATTATNHIMPKQRPVVTVLPNKQLTNFDDEKDGTSCLSDVKAGTVTYRADSIESKQPPSPSLPPPSSSASTVMTKKGAIKLNLFRTSQILSEFAELPKSLDGATLNPLVGTASREENVGLYSSRGVPPPPAPVPFSSIVDDAQYGRHGSFTYRQPYGNDGVIGAHYATLGGTSTQSQPSTPRNVQRLITAPITVNGDEFSGEYAMKEMSNGNLRRQFHSNESFGDFDNIIRDLSHHLDVIQHPSTDGRNQQQQSMFLQQQQQKQEQKQRYLPRQYVQQRQQQYQQLQKQQQQQQLSMASTRR